MLTRPAFAALLFVLAIAGCASSQQAGAAAPVPSPSSSSSPDVIDLPLPGSGKPAVGGAETVTGTVSAGVEANCLLLTSGGTSHLLIFKDPALRANAPVGKTVTVTGRSEPSMVSTCMQGTPFIVTSVAGG
jgi:hypothetical protein